MKIARSESESLSAAMMAYPKRLAREAREDRRLADQTRELSLRTKAAKLKEQNQTLGAAMQESVAKAEIAMAASGAGRARDRHRGECGGVYRGE